MKLLFLGDFFCNNAIDLSSETVALFKNHDRLFVNFEAPIKLNKDDLPIEKVGVCLSHDKSVVSTLLSLGVTDLCLANNHFFDFGVLNVEGNLRLLEKVFNLHGVYNSEYHHHKIGKFAIINVAESEYGAGLSGVHFISISDPKLFVIFKEVLEKGLKIILVVHAGYEDSTRPLDSWKSYYRAFIDFGVELIIGHHPHVPQHHEIYKSKHIFYSLGNFVFNTNPKTRLHSIGKFASIELLYDSIQVNYGYTCFKNKELSLLSLEDTIQIDSELLHDFTKEYCLRDAYNYRTDMDFKRLILVKFPFLRKILSRKKSRHIDFHIHNLKFETHRFSQLEYLEKCRINSKKEAS